MAGQNGQANGRAAVTGQGFTKVAPQGGQTPRGTTQRRVQVGGQQGGSRAFVGGVTINAGGGGNGGQRGGAAGRFLPNAGEPGGGRAQVGDALVRAVQAMTTIQIESPRDLHQLLEAAREVGHTMGFYASLAAGELGAQMKAAEKAQSALGLMSPGAYGRVRQVTREIDRISDSFGDAAKHAAAAWRFFVRNFQEDMSRASSTKVPAPKRGFSFTE